MKPNPLYLQGRNKWSLHQLTGTQKRRCSHHDPNYDQLFIKWRHKLVIIVMELESHLFFERSHGMEKRIQVLRFFVFFLLSASLTSWSHSDESRDQRTQRRKETCLLSPQETLSIIPPQAGHLMVKDRRWGPFQTRIHFING